MGWKKESLSLRVGGFWAFLFFGGKAGMGYREREEDKFDR